MSEVIRLAEAHVDPGVMMAFIQNSGQTYAPTSDDLIYLFCALAFPRASSPRFSRDRRNKPSQSLPWAVLLTEALLDVQPQDAASNVFTETLAPYGNWVQVPEQRRRPGSPRWKTANPDWKPDADGQWSMDGFRQRMVLARNPNIPAVGFGAISLRRLGQCTPAISGWSVWVPGTDLGPGVGFVARGEFLRRLGSVAARRQSERFVAVGVQRPSLSGMDSILDWRRQPTRLSAPRNFSTRTCRATSSRPAAPPLWPPPVLS